MTSFSILGVVACGLALAVIGFYLSSVLPTQWLKVERMRVPLGARCKIVQISDIHIERNRIRKSTLANAIRSEQPDIICLTGDFLDTEAAMLRLVPFLRMIQEFHVPTFAVLGNHDYRLKNPHALVELLESFGVRVLRNESVSLERLQIVGIDDYCTRHHDEDEAFKHVETGKPTLIITHDPTITLAIRTRYDYLIAGHFHGKQFALPGLSLIHI